MSKIEDALREAAIELVALIEGPGCLRWQSPGGARLKDEGEWTRFYVATKNAQNALSEPAPVEARSLDTCLTLAESARWQREDFSWGQLSDLVEELAMHALALQARIAEVEGETVERCANAKRCKSPGACDARKLCGRFRSSTLISSEPASPSDP